METLKFIGVIMAVALCIMLAIISYYVIVIIGIGVAIYVIARTVTLMRKSGF